MKNKKKEKKCKHDFSVLIKATNCYTKYQCSKCGKQITKWDAD